MYTHIYALNAYVPYSRKPLQENITKHFASKRVHCPFLHKYLWTFVNGGNTSKGFHPQKWLAYESFSCTHTHTHTHTLTISLTISLSNSRQSIPQWEGREGEGGEVRGWEELHPDLLLLPQGQCEEEEDLLHLIETEDTLYFNTNRSKISVLGCYLSFTWLFCSVHPG